jgi:hypothetical protein
MTQWPDLASAMFPSLSREARERDAVAAQWGAEQKVRKEKFLADLRELNAKLARQREERR